LQSLLRVNKLCPGFFSNPVEAEFSPAKALQAKELQASDNSSPPFPPSFKLVAFMQATPECLSAQFLANQKP
jgi:hypothetical protein